MVVKKIKKKNQKQKQKQKQSQRNQQKVSIRTSGGGGFSGGGSGGGGGAGGAGGSGGVVYLPQPQQPIVQQRQPEPSKPVDEPPKQPPTTITVNYPTSPPPPPPPPPIVPPRGKGKGKGKKKGIKGKPNPEPTQPKPEPTEVVDTPMAGDDETNPPEEDFEIVKSPKKPITVVDLTKEPDVKIKTSGKADTILNDGNTSIRYTDPVRLNNYKDQQIGLFNSFGRRSEEDVLPNTSRQTNALMTTTAPVDNRRVQEDGAREEKVIDGITVNESKDNRRREENAQSEKVREELSNVKEDSIGGKNKSKSKREREAQVKIASVVRGKKARQEANTLREENQRDMKERTELEQIGVRNREAIDRNRAEQAQTTIAKVVRGKKARQEANKLKADNQRELEQEGVRNSERNRAEQAQTNIAKIVRGRMGRKEVNNIREEVRRDEQTRNTLMKEGENNMMNTRRGRDLVRGITSKRLASEANLGSDNKRREEDKAYDIKKRKQREDAKSRKALQQINSDLQESYYKKGLGGNTASTQLQRRTGK